MAGQTLAPTSSAPGDLAPRPEGGPPPRPSGRGGRRRTEWGGVLLVAPLVALLVAFVFVPLGRVVWYSLSDYDGFSPATWTGLDNYEFLFSWSDFQSVLRNSVLLVCGLVVWVVAPFVVAVILHGARHASLIRAMLFLPALLPPIVAGRIFQLVLADGGPINSGLRAVHLKPLAVPWLTDERVVLVSVVLMIAWAVLGSGVLFYSVGLNAMSTSYVDAAIIDGARWHQLVWHIYRPALRSVTQFWTLLLIVGTVTSFFPWIYGLTKGGPGTASTTLDYLVYRDGIQGGNLGRASAVAVVGLLVIVVLLAGQLVTRRMRAAGDWT